MVSIEEMRVECVRHYVERGYTPAHAEMYIPIEEAEIRRIYGCIQEEKESDCTQDTQPFPNLTNEETAAE